jgi:broad specificity phosphatase PhoE
VTPRSSDDGFIDEETEFGPGGLLEHLKLATLQTAMNFTLIVEYVGPEPEGEVFEARSWDSRRSSPMLLYLRHGDDRGDDSYRQDRRLSPRGKRKVPKKVLRLIEAYRQPDTVFVSPYRRALDTLEAVLPYFQHRPYVVRDARIARRLSDKQQRDPSVSPQTLEPVNIHETDKMFRARVASHVEEVRRRAAEEEDVWCITHQAVIKEIAAHFGVKIHSGLDFLDILVALL